jgi:predicted patatin/cPLA2 family phospholipase
MKTFEELVGQITEIKKSLKNIDERLSELKKLKHGGLINEQFSFFEMKLNKLEKDIKKYDEDFKLNCVICGKPLAWYKHQVEGQRERKERFICLECDGYIYEIT